ncbi:DUF2092 domain-containing protein [Nitratifractor sp.]
MAGALMALLPLSGEGVKGAGLMTKDPAAEILRRAYRHLDEMGSFTLEAVTVNEDVYRETLVTEVHHRIRVALQRPDRLRIDIVGDSKDQSYFFKAGKFDLFDWQFRLYGQLNTPETIDGMLDYIYDSYGIASPLANLLYSDLEDRLMPKGRGFYLGVQKIGGIPCHHLGFVNKAKELQVWVQAEGDPLIRRFVIIDKSTPWRLHSATTLQWNPGKFRQGWFDFVPPKDAVEISIEPAK